MAEVIAVSETELGNMRLKIIRILHQTMCVRKFVLYFFTLLLFQLCFQTKIYADGIKVFRTEDKKTMSYQQMISDLKDADIVFIGETHDQENHHRIQLDIIKTFNNLKVPVIIGLEMIIAENQDILDRWISGSIALDDFVKEYYKNWNFPWPLYRDIFLYLREYKISTIGLNISPEITRKIAKSGFSSLSKDELSKLPPETGCAVDEQYMRFIRRAYAMHGHNNRNFIYFCEAQLIWDRVMARNVFELFKKHPNKKIIVLTGNGHAWKRGIPEQIMNLSKKINYRVLLPNIPGHIDPHNITQRDADYILFN